MCVLSLCCGGVAADVRYDFALLPLYGVRLVTDTNVTTVCGGVQTGYQSDRCENCFSEW